MHYTTDSLLLLHHRTYFSAAISSSVKEAGSDSRSSGSTAQSNDSSEITFHDGTVSWKGDHLSAFSPYKVKIIKVYNNLILIYTMSLAF